MSPPPEPSRLEGEGWEGGPRNRRGIYARGTKRLEAIGITSAPCNIFSTLVDALAQPNHAQRLIMTTIMLPTRPAMFVELITVCGVITVVFFR